MAESPYTTQCDVYSFGIIMWEVLTRERLFPDMHPFAVAYKVMSERLRPPIPPECPEDLKKVMEESWNQDPLVRPSFEELIEKFDKFSTIYASKFINHIQEFKAVLSNQLLISESVISSFFFFFLFFFFFNFLVNFYSIFFFFYK